MEDAWVPIGKLTDFPDGKAVKASLDDETDLLVLRRGEEVLVVSNRCTHQGTPLHRGRLHAAGNLVTITCPLHGSLFSLTDGRVLRGPATSRLPSYEARVISEIVEIRQRR
jgi:nitrite reductase/ring-hydroxylating ferredoxin subunit